MGVYIKSMEMPKEPIALIIYPDGKVFRVSHPEQIAEAVPVPPHGRLIESKAFLQVVHKTDNFSLDELAHLAVLVAATPTIIPAEEGET